MYQHFVTILLVLIDTIIRFDKFFSLLEQLNIFVSNTFVHEHFAKLLKEIQDDIPEGEFHSERRGDFVLNADCNKLQVRRKMHVHLLPGVSSVR